MPFEATPSRLRKASGYIVGIQGLLLLVRFDPGLRKGFSCFLMFLVGFWLRQILVGLGFNRKVAGTCVQCGRHPEVSLGLPQEQQL